MYWILLLVAVSLTLILIVTVPQNILRTAIGNCTRADGSKSVRRRQRERRNALSFLGGIVVIPIILITIHVSATVMVEHFYVEYIPEDWVAKIELADTVDNDVNEVMSEFSEWNEQQQVHNYANMNSWQDAIWDNWMYFAADAVLMSIVVYFFLGPYYLLLVSSYTKGVERRHRVYMRIDSKRSAKEQDDDESFPNDGFGTDDEQQESNSGNEEHKPPVSPFMDLNDYISELSREGFLDAVFTGLQIPGKQLSRIQEKESENTLFDQSAGTEHLVKNGRSQFNSSIEQNGWHESAVESLRTVESELKALRVSQSENGDSSTSPILALEQQVKELDRKISLIQSDDSSTRADEEGTQSAKKAVLFCLMDVSSSMEGDKIDIAKRFLILFFLFLQRIQESLEVVYIQHHATAQELDEDGFFDLSHKSGTVISSSLELLHDILLKRYTGPQWEVYAAQVSDGENSDGDSLRCRDVLKDKILPLMRYYIYVETSPGESPSLRQALGVLDSEYDNFAMQRIDAAEVLYSKFRALFDKRFV